MTQRLELPTRYMRDFDDYYSQHLEPQLKALRRGEGLRGKYRVLTEGPLAVYPQAFELIFNGAVDHLNLAYAPGTSAPAPFELKALAKALPGFDGMLESDNVSHFVRHRDLNFDAFCCCYGKDDGNGQNPEAGFGFSNPDWDQSGVVLRCLLPEKLESGLLVASNDMRLLEDDGFDPTIFAVWRTVETGEQSRDLSVYMTLHDPQHPFWDPRMQTLLRAVSEAYGPVTAVFDGRWLDIMVWAVGNPYEFHDHARDFHKTARVSASRLSVLPELVDVVKEINGQA